MAVQEAKQWKMCEVMGSQVNRREEGAFLSWLSQQIDGRRESASVLWSGVTVHLCQPGVQTLSKTCFFLGRVQRRCMQQ